MARDYKAEYRARVAAGRKAGATTARAAAGHGDSVTASSTVTKDVRPGRARAPRATASTKSPEKRSQRPRSSTKATKVPPIVDAPMVCGWCGAPVEQPRVGRTRKFCGDGCRIAMHRFNKGRSYERPMSNARSRFLQKNGRPAGPNDLRYHYY
jgi:hypothetical protein